MAEKEKMPKATAIFHITEIKKAFEKDHLDTEAEALQMGIDALQQPKWIPCSERLPEKEGRYLVWAAISFIPDHVDDPDMYHGTTIASYFEQFGRHHWYGDHVEEVIAWMPLPEPY